MPPDEQYICSKMFTDLNIKFAYNTVKNCCKTSNYNLPTQSIELLKSQVFFRDPEFTGRKLSMIRDNQLPPACDSCIKTHPNSLFRVWNEWPHKIEQADKNKLLYKDNFSLYELVLSSACDLKCIYCSEKDSTSWAREKGLKPVMGDPVWKERVLENLFVHLGTKHFDPQQIYWFFFSGGEPTYNPETLTMIKKIMEIVPHSLLRLVITTNVNTKADTFAKYMKLIDSHPKVSWGFDCSLDGLSNQCEAIRYGLRWERALQNLTQLLQRPTVQVRINHTCNAFSVPGLPEFVSYFIELFLKYGRPLGFGANMVMEDGLSVMLLPRRFRSSIDETVRICEKTDLLYKEGYLQHLRNVGQLIGTQTDSRSYHCLQIALQYFAKHRPETNYLDLFPHIREILRENSIPEDL